MFQNTIGYMAENISDFENVALPPKKRKIVVTNNPVIKVNATSKDSWTLLDFASGKSHTITDPDTDKEKLKTLKWDLGFQRTKIITNSGDTNSSGNVGVVNLGQVDFNTITEAPEAGYIQDKRKWGKILNKSISNWYNYRTRTHNIESQKYVYAVRNSEGKYFKMKILNYYCLKKESDCATSMCNRNEAACLTIEYVFQPNGDRLFPKPQLPKRPVVKAETETVTTVQVQTP
jgi:hypothetical protein|tara:strand:+ start:86 stop:781 length:696 start_codon:yes stop_codon:yes gene_type:complete